MIMRAVALRVNVSLIATEKDSTGNAEGVCLDLNSARGLQGELNINPALCGAKMRNVNK
ncbi:hypothetical protein MJK72_04415 [Klebsiella pneumoniae]|nr:hypothetical protein MJK72_04415 [Klebsiella pneumoniae]